MGNPILPEQGLFVSTNFSEGSHKIENPSPPYGMKNSFKNTVPLDKKYLSLAGVS